MKKRESRNAPKNMKKTNQPTTTASAPETRTDEMEWQELGKTPEGYLLWTKLDDTGREIFKYERIQPKATEGGYYDRKSAARLKNLQRTIPAEKPTQWHGAYDSEGKLRATFDSESEAYHYVRNRGHMHGGSDKPIVQAQAAQLAEALRDALKYADSATEHPENKAAFRRIVATALATYESDKGL